MPPGSRGEPGLRLVVAECSFGAGIQTCVRVVRQGGRAVQCLAPGSGEKIVGNPVHDLVGELVAARRAGALPDDPPGDQLLQRPRQGRRCHTHNQRHQGRIERAPQDRGGFNGCAGVEAEAVKPAAHDLTDRSRKWNRPPRLRRLQTPGAGIGGQQQPIVHQCGRELDDIERVATGLGVQALGQMVPGRRRQLEH